MNMFLSIVIPAYNEQDKIARDIAAAAAYLSSASDGGELIVVDDGSTDTTVAAAAKACDNAAIETRVLTIAHAGKGAAVRNGIIASRGDVVMFADAGLCISYEEADRGIALVRSGRCDVAHGSRYHPESIIVKKKGLFRRFASAVFRAALPVAVGIRGSYTDTQCGFKVYNGDVARRIYGACVSDGYFFDLEVILRAERAGASICEFPVHWKSDSDSRLSLFRSLAEVFFAVQRIRGAVHH